MLLPVQPVQLLVIHLPAAPGQQHAQPPVAVARFLLGQSDHLFPKPAVIAGSWFVAVAAAIHLQELAGLAFAHLELLDDERHVPPRVYKLQPFFRITAFSASRSRLRSATNFFSSPFSRSSSR